MPSVPTRDFLEEERGVMLLFKNGFTGVTLSWVATVARETVPLPLRRAWEAVLVLVVLAVAIEVVVVGTAARRGVKGVFAVRLLASVGFSGGRGWL